MITEPDLTKMLGEDELIMLATAEEVGAVKVLMKVLKIVRDGDRALVEQHPKRDDADLRNDWVFKTGGISRLNDVLQLPQVAMGIIKKRG